jgi:uncharacterized protein YegP (UPF0339 family)
MAGKFELKLSKNNKYFFTLQGGAGQVVLTSEMYETKASAVNGIESVKKNSADDARYHRLAGKDGALYFTLKAANGQVIGQSQMFKDEKERDKELDLCKTDGPGASVSDLTL